MKAQIVVLIACLSMSMATAQTHYQVRKDTVQYEITENKHRVLTNPFWDNWFIGLGAGSQMFFGDHDKQMELGDRQSLVYEFSFGKWFTPGIGVRIGANAGRLNGLTQNAPWTKPAHSTGVRYEKIPWEGYWLEYSELEYFHIKSDVLFNLSNLLYGYKADRFYEISPYVGLGWMVSYNKPKAREVSANLGVYNTFRLSDAFDLTLDIRGASVNDRFDQEGGERKEEGLLTAIVGLKYNIRKRDWDRAKYKEVRYNEGDIEALREMARENETLRQQLADAKGKTITEIVVEKERSVLAAPILVTFPIDTWIVSNEARVNLGFFAKVIKEGDPNIVYQITGYADKGTGSKKRNEKLSRERANVIFNVLVEEFGVSPSQLRKDHKGGVDNMFYDDPRVSRAVIVRAE